MGDDKSFTVVDYEADNLLPLSHHHQQQTKQTEQTEENQGPTKPIFTEQNQQQHQQQQQQQKQASREIYGYSLGGAISNALTFTLLVLPCFGYAAGQFVWRILATCWQQVPNREQSDIKFIRNSLGFLRVGLLWLVIMAVLVALGALPLPLWLVYVFTMQRSLFLIPMSFGQRCVVDTFLRRGQRDHWLSLIGTMNQHSNPSDKGGKAEDQVVTTVVRQKEIVNHEGIDAHHEHEVPTSLGLPSTGNHKSSGSLLHSSKIHPFQEETSSETFTPAASHSTIRTNTNKNANILTYNDARTSTDTSPSPLDPQFPSRPLTLLTTASITLLDEANVVDVGEDSLRRGMDTESIAGGTPAVHASSSMVGSPSPLPRRGIERRSTRSSPHPSDHTYGLSRLRNARSPVRERTNNTFDYKDTISAASSLYHLHASTLKLSRPASTLSLSAGLEEGNNGIISNWLPLDQRIEPEVALARQRQLQGRLLFTAEEIDQILSVLSETSSLSSSVSSSASSAAASKTDDTVGGMVDLSITNKSPVEKEPQQTLVKSEEDERRRAAAAQENKLMTMMQRQEDVLRHVLSTLSSSSSSSATVTLPQQMNVTNDAQLLQQQQQQIATLSQTMETMTAQLHSQEQILHDLLAKLSSLPSPVADHSA